jgi:hypothetical protein
MMKADFLKRLAIAAVAMPVAILGRGQKAEAAGDDDALLGLWEAVVRGEQAVYRYIYSISRGSYVATGSVDENFMNFKYSPTMGEYTRIADRSYKYRERGYVFDLKGTNVGTFTSTGSFQLNAAGNAFRGPGTFTQYDLKSKPIATETFTMTATRVYSLTAGGEPQLSLAPYSGPIPSA